jgi:hypothetical protein
MKENSENGRSAHKTLLENFLNGELKNTHFQSLAFYIMSHKIFHLF